MRTEATFSAAAADSVIELVCRQIIYILHSMQYCRTCLVTRNLAEEKNFSSRLFVHQVSRDADKFASFHACSAELQSLKFAVCAY